MSGMLCCSSDVSYKVLQLKACPAISSRANMVDGSLASGSIACGAEGLLSHQLGTSLMCKLRLLRWVLQSGVSHGGVAF